MAESKHMTRQRDFKKLVRERMRRTGESYTTARSHVLIEEPSHASTLPGLIAGYACFGGLQGDTSVLTNVLRFAGLRKPDGREYSEALVAGLCGGIGFLYAVFEYRGMPPMLTIVARSNSMADAFIAEGLGRCGAQLDTREASTEGAAMKHLLSALDAGKPALCTVDMVSLPYSGMPAQWAGMSPHVVAAVGRHGDSIWLDDRAVEPIAISMAEFAHARSRYRKGKNRLVTLRGRTQGFDLAQAVREAVALTVKSFHQSPVKSFASNFGFAGLEKWQRLLTDKRDPKGWPKVFASGREALAGLGRAYECLQHEYTGPAAGRPLYAEFLAEAAWITGDNRFAEVTQKFRASGVLWDGLTERIRHCPDAAVKRRCEITDIRAELLDAQGAKATPQLKALFDERMELGNECKLNAAGAGELYAAIAGDLGRIIGLEREAVEQLRTLSSN